MTIEQLDAYHQRRPFQPFRIFLSDGREYYAEHPEYLARSPNGRTFGIFDLEDGSLDVIDLLHVTSLKLSGNVEPRRFRSETNSLTSENGPR